VEMAANQETLHVINNIQGVIKFVGTGEKLTGLEPGQVLYIGDHPTDIRCAEHANRELAGLGRSLRVVSVAALWGLEAGDDRWATTADHRAVTPNEVVELVERLARDQD